MSPEGLQKYIEEHIPIVAKNGIRVVRADSNSVAVQARFEDHINHRGSVFGGSLATAMTVAAWAFVRNLVDSNGTNAMVVIAEENVRFKAPVVEDFEAETLLPEEHELERFLDQFQRRGKAKISIQAVLRPVGKEVAATFSGDFVAIRS